MLYNLCLYLEYCIPSFQISTLSGIHTSSRGWMDAIRLLYYVHSARNPDIISQAYLLIQHTIILCSTQSVSYAEHQMNAARKVSKKSRLKRYILSFLKQSKDSAALRTSEKNRYIYYIYVQYINIYIYITEV